MRIVVVNPNTTAFMTETVRVAAVAAASPGADVLAVTLAMGPDDGRVRRVRPPPPKPYLGALSAFGT
jgi:hypothetical protein